MNSKQATILVRGAVQGVGFRPFVYRLARELNLAGGVRNTGQGVIIEVEGTEETLGRFLSRLKQEKPPRSIIEGVECSFQEGVGQSGFAIHPSSQKGDKATLVLPDIATCTDCLEELFEPGNRRYRYPFTNCTHCGPRFSIIEGLPYDRENTSMKKFRMCGECEAEYLDPVDRRFHAEPNCCPECGPQLVLWDPEGNLLTTRHEALLAAAQGVRAGQVVAMKGLGGFQLVVDARNHEAVLRLRARKRRIEKPFALIYPDLESIRRECFVSEEEEALLRSAQAPIVLLEKRAADRSATSISPAVAPSNPRLGVMLPSTPLHHLLITELQRPIVATSGNSSDEPICIDEQEALARFRDIADLLLIHDRPIVRHMDDSVSRVVLGGEQVLRRARGYAPLPIRVQAKLPTVLAVGAHLKNSIALGIGNAVFVSQHIGDLETGLAYAAFRRAVEDLPALYEAIPGMVACDLHPDYLSSQYAAGLAVPRHGVQHHWAHVAACMAENQIDGPVLGIAWDGTGLGPDGTIWGGEFLAGSPTGYKRVAHLRTFRLPGANAAVKQPRLTALGLLLELMSLDDLRKRRLALLDGFSENELKLIQQMLAKGVSTPITSSAGRLFDAVAGITGLRQRTSFEGQAAMELEFMAERGIRDAYPFALSGSSPIILDWAPMILKILEDIQAGTSIGPIAAKFQNTLVEMMLAVARNVGRTRVILTGGCFQNKFLMEQTVRRLREEGFDPYWHRQVPPNDGGIALGQVTAAAWALEADRPDSEREQPRLVSTVHSEILTDAESPLPSTI